MWSLPGPWALSPPAAPGWARRGQPCPGRSGDRCARRGGCEAVTAHDLGHCQAPSQDSPATSISGAGGVETCPLSAKAPGVGEQQVDGWAQGGVTLASSCPVRCLSLLGAPSSPLLLLLLARASGSLWRPGPMCRVPPPPPGPQPAARRLGTPEDGTARVSDGRARPGRRGSRLAGWGREALGPPRTWGRPGRVWPCLWPPLPLPALTLDEEGLWRGRPGRPGPWSLLRKAAQRGSSPGRPASGSHRTTGHLCWSPWACRGGRKVRGRPCVSCPLRAPGSAELRNSPLSSGEPQGGEWPAPVRSSGWTVVLRLGPGGGV